MIFFLQYENHSKSLELEEQTLLKITSRIQEKVMNNAGTWIDWQYLLYAAFILQEKYHDFIHISNIVLESGQLQCYE
jgi:ariadne-2